MMENAPIETTSRKSNRRSNSNSSTIFSKVEVVQSAVINLTHKIIGWNTMFFDVINYDPPTLPGACAELLLGVNRKNLIIIRKRQL